MLQSWSFWRRALNIAIGILALVPTYFILSDPQTRLVAFTIAALNILLGAIPDSAVARVTGLRL
jgi:hypothetical protein